MRLKVLLSMIPFVFTLFFFPIIAKADPITWSTETYESTSYARFYCDLHIFEDSDFASGPPLPISTHARISLPWCYWGYGEVNGYSTVSGSMISVDADSYIGIGAWGQGSFSGVYTADQPFFQFYYDYLYSSVVSTDKEIIITVTDVTSGTTFYEKTIDDDIQQGNDAIFVETEIGHDIDVSFSAKVSARNDEVYRSIGSLDMSYSMAAVASPWTRISGIWQWENGEYSGHDTTGPVGIATRNYSQTTDMMSIEADLFMQTDGDYKNGFIIFDYQGPNDFKYVGAKPGVDRWIIGYYDGNWNDLVVFTDVIDTLRWYRLRVEIIGTTVKLYADDDRDGSSYEYKTEATFASMGTGQTGYAVYWSHANFDNYISGTFVDQDGDGYSSAIDCDDNNAAVFPEAIEVCDGADNNCDGNIDEGFDVDGDTYTTCAGDCNDGDPDIHPGMLEVAGNCIDDDCNAETPDSTINNDWLLECIDNYGDVGSYNSIVLDSADNIHISYYDSTNYALKYATNATGTWITYTIDSAEYVGRYSSIAVDSSDNVHISYYRSGSLGGGDDLKYATNVTGTWITSTVSAAGQVGGYSSIAIDSAGNVHISHLDFGPWNLMYTTNTSGAWVTTIADSAETVGRSTSIGIDSSDNVHISYYDYYYDRLKYATNASGSWVASAIDSSGDVGYDTSLAIDSSDNVHISYSGGTNVDLKYATNLSGSWVTSTIDSTGWVGHDSSIAIDSSDNVHISYRGINGDLKYATNTSGSWAASTLDSTGSAGWNTTSIAIDSLDNVHISYFDISNNNLKYATTAILSSVSGTWQQENGEYSGDGGGSVSAIALRDSSATTDYMVIEADMYMNPGSFKNGLIIFDYQGPTDFKYVIGNANGDYWGIGYYDGSWNEPALLNQKVDAERWYRIRAVIIGNTVKLYVDDDRDGSGYVFKTDYTYSSIASGSFGLGAVYGHTHFDNYTERFDDLDDDGYNSVTDCDDLNSTLNPLTYWYPDSDGDGYGNPTVYLQQCTQPIDYVLDNTDCDDSDENIYPGGPPVRIADAAPIYYTTIQAAYDVALNGDVIQIKDTNLSEDLIFDQVISVTLEGGYDCSYASAAGRTTVTGDMNVSSGTVTLVDIILD